MPPLITVSSDALSLFVATGRPRQTTSPSVGLQPASFRTFDGQINRKSEQPRRELEGVTVERDPIEIPGVRPWRVRGGALLEVVAAFAVVHVAYRSFRAFTPLGRLEAQRGWVFSFGVIAVTVGLLAILLPPGGRPRGERLRASGLIGFDLWSGLRCGLFFLFGAIAVGATLQGVATLPSPRTSSLAQGAIIGALGLATTMALLAWSRGSVGLRWLPRPAVALLTLFIFSVPLIWSAQNHEDLSVAATTMAWRSLVAGFGEEIFFRGYIQSRLNRAWGRPWKLFRVPFGPGLIFTAILFAFVHALNTVDYFHGSYHFSWGHALSTLTLAYGFLREKTGSVLAPAVLHGGMNALGTIAWA
ncbi:MAG: CPBP family intramembrane metalloprotease [Planctomycetes bacterium]|nr:CPBP family intramembrane metalloprotease [Planctomycetota bacterium]